MLLKYFYDPALAHASYLVGCQRAGEAAVIDPGRDIQPYLAMAAREGMQITVAAETHIHADYVSGARELADRVGAKLCLSDAGPPEWRYQFAEDYDHQLLNDGDRFRVGHIRFDVLFTPGHTPESISFLLTDEGGGATEPMGIFTGDFVFVGSIGRPDLLEEAAGVVGSAETGARQLYESLQRFRQLPDYLQVWPAHGAGSACGKGLGAVPSSTVGYEKRFNPALQFESEEEFIQYILAEQPPAPKYFAVMKRVNKEGPSVLGERPLTSVSVAELPQAIQQATVVDLSPAREFMAAHVPGTINIPLTSFATWAGWLVDYERPLYLICHAEYAAEAQRVATKMGMDQLVGYFEAGEVAGSGYRTESYAEVTPDEIRDRIETGEVSLIDVRGDAEWQAGHIAEAEHLFLGHLSDPSPAANRDKPIVTQCLGGGRSAIAASVLQAQGGEVMNLKGGIRAWQQAGLPIVTPTPVDASHHA